MLWGFHIHVDILYTYTCLYFIYMLILYLLIHAFILYALEGWGESGRGCGWGFRTHTYILTFMLYIYILTCILYMYFFWGLHAHMLSCSELEAWPRVWLTGPLFPFEGCLLYSPPFGCFGTAYLIFCLARTCNILTTVMHAKFYENV